MSYYHEITTYNDKGEIIYTKPITYTKKKANELKKGDVIHTVRGLDLINFILVDEKNIFILVEDIEIKLPFEKWKTIFVVFTQDYRDSYTFTVYDKKCQSLFYSPYMHLIRERENLGVKNFHMVYNDLIKMTEKLENKILQYTTKIDWIFIKGIIINV